MREQICTYPIAIVLSLCSLALASPAAIPSSMPPFTQILDMDSKVVMQRLRADSQGRTPTLKQFDPDWIGSLDEQGEAIVYTRDNSENFEYIGMPVGGICAGQLYLGGDGKLWYWDIFNTKAMRDTHSIHTHRNPYKRTGEDRACHYPVQGFALRVHNRNQTVIKTLDRDGFQDITFTGTYPIGRVAYQDADLPVNVSLEAFSPFIPLDLENSNYPATVLAYTVTNTSSKRVRGELLGWLENAVCIDSRTISAGQLRNRVQRSDNATMVVYTAEPPDEAVSQEPLRPEILFEGFEGDLSKWTVQGEAFAGNPKPNFHHQALTGFKGKGLVDSFRNGGRDGASAADSDAYTGKLISPSFKVERKAIKLWVGGGSHANRTCAKVFVDNKVVHQVTGRNSETLEARVLNMSKYQGKTARIEIVDRHQGGWGHILVDHIVFTDDTRAITRPLDQQLDYGSMALAVLDNSAEALASASFDAPQGDLSNVANATAAFEDAALVGMTGRSFTLAPGESTQVRFILSWYFPTAPRFPISTEQGRYYGKRFKDALDVAQQMANNYDSLAAQTRLWRDTWYDSTLPYWFLDRTFLNASTLATNTCYLFRDGRFYGYEAVYHGHGTCNHVWGYVQAPGRLFPMLEQRLREMVDYQPGVGFEPESGRIRQRSEARKDDAADGQSGCIFRTYLVHQMQADNAFLQRVYPWVKKAMNYMTNTYDMDRDGILTGPQFNTLDAAWYGKITWISLHYGGALRATAAMADDMGDTAYATQCRALADKGRQYIEDKLFNGEYFFHEADPEHPESPGVYSGLEYSQLLGQSWAYQVGLGQIIDPEKATTHLTSLWKYNFSTDVGPFREKYENGRWYAMPGEGGIIACTWPYGGDEALTKGHQHFAGYLNECQPGYEWAATSLLMWHGMQDRALAHTRTMHERYSGSKRNPWNEVEWGDHYSRSMASYGVFTGACGFEYHGPRAYMAFSPRVTPEAFRAAFTSAQGWGTFSQRRLGNTQSARLQLRWGKLALQHLAFDIPAGKTVRKLKVTVNGEDKKANYDMQENRVRIGLAKRASIDPGQEIRLDMSW